MAVFPVGRECPWSCVFCDLWRHTLDGDTPAGSLPRQVRAAREALDGWPSGSVLKLYNAASFFDPRAVPEDDLEAIATLCAGASRVVVECHPLLIVRHQALWRRFAAALPGVELEVALGLETANDAIHRRLGKGTRVDDVARAADRLLDAGVAWRAFTLVGTPWVPAERHAGDAIETVAWAVERGAGHVALIPVRGGNGALEQLAASGAWSPPRLSALEEALEGGLLEAGARAVVSADLWDLGRVSDCAACFPARRDRLDAANLAGSLAAREPCAECERGISGPTL